jgi:hypothetical protein
LIDNDLRARIERLLGGHHNVHDLDRLFLALRERAHERECFRELGDFVAHREERQKGLVTQTGRDLFTSIDVWSLGLRGQKPSINDITRAAWANFRLASESQLKEGCGLQRGTVKGRLKSGLSKLERGQGLAEQEIKVISYLGNRFIWKPAFTDEQLFNEFREVLLLNSIIVKADIQALDGIRTFLALYAISCMHGSAVLLENGKRAELLAGFSNQERRLEVKMQIGFDDAPKPIMAPICLFLTALQPEDHCDDELLELGDKRRLPFAWSEPVEVRSDGRLALVKRDHS